MYKIKFDCRCCGSENLSKYADFGMQPLANSYHNYDDMSAYFPLEVNFCNTCYHSQLSIVVDPKLMFENYLYVSGTTKTFKEHCNQLAQFCLEKSSLNSNKTKKVLDIAANDGTLLNSFSALGFDTYGVDPAKNLLQYSKANCHHIYNDYFNENVVGHLFNSMDVITGTNVFAHVDDIKSFLNICSKVLNKDGILVLEFPYCQDMIRHNEFDTIYHEHLSYFTINSFAYVANTSGFIIDNISMTKIHGGSVRFLLKTKSHGKTNCLELQNFLQKEQDMGLHNVNSYYDFFRRAENNRVEFHHNIYKSKYKVIGYGASAKGNTMLNFFKCNLDYIVDDNSLKWNKLTPGRNIKILPPSTLETDNDNLAIVILSWNFYDEIKNKIQKLRKDKKTILIRYVPEYSEEIIN